LIFTLPEGDDASIGIEIGGFHTGQLGMAASGQKRSPKQIAKRWFAGIH